MYVWRFLIDCDSGRIENLYFDRSLHRRLLCLCRSLQGQLTGSLLVFDAVSKRAVPEIAAIIVKLAHALVSLCLISVLQMVPALIFRAYKNRLFCSPVLDLTISDLCFLVLDII